MRCRVARLLDRCFGCLLDNFVRTFDRCFCFGGDGFVRIRNWLICGLRSFGFDLRFDRDGFALQIFVQFAVDAASDLVIAGFLVARRHEFTICFDSFKRAVSRVEQFSDSCGVSRIVGV